MLCFILNPATQTVRLDIVLTKLNAEKQKELFLANAF